MIKTTEIADKIGIDYRTVVAWIDSDLLDVRQEGPRDEYRWTTCDAARAAAISWLKRVGLGVKSIRKKGLVAQLTDEAIRKPGAVLVYDPKKRAAYVTTKVELRCMRKEVAPFKVATEMPVLLVLDLGALLAYWEGFDEE